jgi:hypothetical protein
MCFSERNEFTLNLRTIIMMAQVDRMPFFIVIAAAFATRSKSFIDR